MKLSSLFLAVPAALFVLGSGVASAGEAISDAGFRLRGRQVGRDGA